ncbi:MAG: PhnD/SsuA/transferrin family substrate-binding protein [bacterium]
MKHLYVISTIIILISGCSSPEAIDIYTLKGPTGMAMSYMMENHRSIGGRTIDYHIVDSPLRVKAAVLDNASDIAAMPLNLASILYNTHGNIRLLTVNTLGVLYIVGNDTAINSIYDLRSRKIIVTAKGSTPEILLRILLSEHGIDPDRDTEIIYKYKNHSAASGALLAGIAETALIPEPFVTLTNRRNDSIKRLIDISAVWDSLHQDTLMLIQGVLTVRNDFFENNRNFIDSFLLYYDNAVDFANSEYDSANSLYSKFSILPDDIEPDSGFAGRCSMVNMPADSFRDEILKYLRFIHNYDKRWSGGTVPGNEFFISR